MRMANSSARSHQQKEPRTVPTLPTLCSSFFITRGRRGWWSARSLIQIQRSESEPATRSVRWERIIRSQAEGNS